jgi:hypothetical protein
MRIDRVDDPKTIAKFGYSVHTLKPGSKKLVVAKCEFCELDFETRLFLINKHQSVACKRCDAIAAAYVRTKSSLNEHEYYLKCRPKLDFSKIDINATIQKYGY